MKQSKDELDRWGVDRDAKMQLFALAQIDYESANAIIAKLLKKRSDRDELRNVSGFVSRCVRNSRHTIDVSWN